MKEFENIVTIAYWIVLSMLFLFILFRHFYFQKTKHTRIRLGNESIFFRIARILTLVVLPIFLIGLINYIFLLQKGNLFAPYWAKTTLIILLALLLITEIRHNIYLRTKKTNKLFNILFILVSIPLSFILLQSYFSAIRHPSIENSVIISLPFEGKWIASAGGSTGLTNHHDRIKSQKYAIDIVKFGNDGKLFNGEGKTNQESHTFGAAIISPVNGTIVHIVDSLPDIKNTDKDKLAGNHIIIQFQDSLYVALAHLKQHSIKVKIGDKVDIGTPLAVVGNSGNTDFPHLHIHVQNTPVYDIETTKTYPLRFSSFKRMRYIFWAKQTNEFLLSNDIIQSE